MSSRKPRTRFHRKATLAICPECCYVHSVRVWELRGNAKPRCPKCGAYDRVGVPHQVYKVC